MEEITLHVVLKAKNIDMVIGFSNLLEIGSFEKVNEELPEVTWSDRYTYKEGK